MTKLSPIHPLTEVLSVRQTFSASELDKALRATLPGRQQEKNLGPFMKLARIGFARTLRRLAQS